MSGAENAMSGAGNAMSGTPAVSDIEAAVGALV